MKKLFIYYSHTGNGDFVSKILTEKGFDIRKYGTEKRVLPKSFFFSMLVGGFKASIGSCPKLEEFNKRLEDYDEVYIGSPIWNGRLATPTNSLLKTLDLKGKKVTFVLYSGSGTSKAADKKIAKLYPEARTIHLKEPKKYPEEAANRLSL
ncbi:MAG: hypothetical protein K6G74_03610 [Bacilli bacterium]|nr:hypothetical protein [Bacilli bacterium]